MRSAPPGATQVIAAPAFHDASNSKASAANSISRDPNLIYEVHPFFDQGVTDDARDRNFGFLVNDVAIFAGDWGAGPGRLRAIPADAVLARSRISIAGTSPGPLTTGACDVVAQNRPPLDDGRPERLWFARSDAGRQRRRRLSGTGRAGRNRFAYTGS